jgi:peptidoglycan/xylan/chitin deacetylase (PgdA/CDA1 family)
VEILTAIRKRVNRTRKQASPALLTIALSIGIISSSCGFMVQRASAAVSQPAATPLISFTFDDGLQSADTLAAPTLAQYGLTGTNYVISGCVGMATTPNTCNADNNKKYMTWAQVQDLQNNYKWEIGSHTVDHYCLASSGQTDPSDCANAMPLTTAQVDTELANSKSALAANGINATDFAPPYGDYSNNVLTEIAKYYASMRQFKNAANNPNVWPYSDYYLQDYLIQEGNQPPATVETAINNAITNKQWLILTFHDIANSPSTNPDNYQYGTSELAQIAAYVQSKVQAGQIKNVNVNNGLVTSTVNFLPNGNFTNGIANGWTTDNPTAVTADANNNGSYPDPAHSVKITSSSAAAHLFSPKITVDSTKTYALKNYLNVRSLTSGEIGYYIDEYDANGNWISGQRKARETTPFVEDMNFTYTPTSSNVKYASLQVYTTANSGITAYVANAQWFALDGSSPITTPTSTNLMTNSNFGAGVSEGWSTDNAAAFQADGSNNGSTQDPQYSVKMTAPASGSAHLLSTKVAVSSATNYTLQAWTNIKTRASGELGVYVDEYNASGAWISGQYLKSITAAGANTTTMSYKPSSPSVTSASLQFILTGGTSITGYLDDANWIAPGNVTPPATPTSVLKETFAGGIANGWTADSGNFTADSGNHGGSDQYSVAYTASPTANIHLFSPHVVVSNGKTYTIASYNNITTMTSGVVGYYIDEYDASGNWVSGQYLKSVNTTDPQTISLNYKPSSPSVAKASLQLIVGSNSGISGYFSDVNWTTP